MQMGTRVAVAVGAALLSLAATANPIPGVIFTKSDLEAALGADASFVGFKPPFWTPTDEDVRRAEAALSQLFEASENPRVARIRPTLGQYRRQYFGHSEGGTAILHINAFCRGHWLRDEN